MNHSESNLKKRRAALKAWLAEKGMILHGEGTRDWTTAQQEKIMQYNRLPGYVAQFVDGSGTEDACRVQWLEACIEYLSAHSGENRNRTCGYLDVKALKLIPPPPPLPQKLSESQAREYQQNQRNLSVGQKNQFGVAVRAAEAESPLPTAAAADADGGIRDRKSRFGF